MSWKEKIKVGNLIGKIHKTVKENDSCYIRCLSGVKRIDIMGGDGKEIWEVKDIWSPGFLPNGMLVTDEAVICNEKLSKNCYVIKALDKKDGRLLWKVEEEKDFSWVGEGGFIAYANVKQAAQNSCSLKPGWK